MDEKPNWKLLNHRRFVYCQSRDLLDIVFQLILGTEIKYSNSPCCGDYHEAAVLGHMWSNYQEGFNHHKFSNDARREILSKEPFRSIYNEFKERLSI